MAKQGKAKRKVMSAKQRSELMRELGKQRQRLLKKELGPEGYKKHMSKKASNGGKARWGT
jgi:hypothetical protein